MKELMIKWENVPADLHGRAKGCYKLANGNILISYYFGDVVEYKGGFFGGTEVARYRTLRQAAVAKGLK